MRENLVSFAPPFCPNPTCRFHRGGRDLWRFVRYGTFARQLRPRVIQRFRCDTCRRTFSTQTFTTGYWLRLPHLLAPTFHMLVACAGYRQIARAFGVSPQTPKRHAARLGRHCQLVHEEWRPLGPIREPIAMDSFESFEYSQYHPTSFHVAVGQRSHFFHGFTESELRRKGRMTARQKRRRVELERRLGRPDPRAVEREVEALLRIVCASSSRVELHTDEHRDYPRAIRRVRHLAVDHRTVSSRAARTPRNPLFAVNLLDLLVRHSGGNHKRETIGFSKRRQGAIERLWIFLTWRNYMKSFSERHPGESPAMRLGMADHLISVTELLARRRFLTRVQLPDRWLVYYRSLTPTRRIQRIAVHRLKFAD